MQENWFEENCHLIEFRFVSLLPGITYFYTGTSGRPVNQNGAVVNEPFNGTGMWILAFMSRVNVHRWRFSQACTHIWRNSPDDAHVKGSLQTIASIFIMASLHVEYVLGFYFSRHHTQVSEEIVCTCTEGIFIKCRFGL